MEAREMNLGEVLRPWRKAESPIKSWRLWKAKEVAPEALENRH